MECTVSWTGASGTRSGMGFVAETGSGHVLALPVLKTAAKTWRHARWKRCWLGRVGVPLTMWC